MPAAPIVVSLRTRLLARSAVSTRPVSTGPVAPAAAASCWAALTWATMCSSPIAIDDACVRSLTDEIARWAVPRGVLVVPQYRSHAKALAALGRGAFDEAYHETASISPARTLPALRAHALWVILDLVEAAARTGRTAEAAAHAAAVSRSRVQDISGRRGQREIMRRY